MSTRPSAASGPEAGSSATWHDYDYAFIRIVPRVHLETFVNVGVVLHARTAGFLDLRLHLDAERLAPLCPAHVRLDLIRQHLSAYERICAGGPSAGAIGLLPASERFHWLTAPRSAILQTSALRAGRTTAPAETLEALFQLIRQG